MKKQPTVIELDRLPYRIVRAETEWELEEQIAKFLFHGWSLVGGATYTGTWWVQAVCMNDKTMYEWRRNYAALAGEE